VKILYLECNMGAAGDMLMAALAQLCPDSGKFMEKMNDIGLKNTVIRAKKVEKQGIVGNSIDVIIDGVTEEEHHHHEHEHHDHHHHCDHDHEHDHAHSSLGDITALIRSLNIPESVKEKSLEVYSLLAQAESHAHGKPVGDIHFHEVGTLDAVCDIVGCCLALDMISPDRVIVSPVHLGFGSVKCRHGILPVPAPATAYILRGVPVYGGEIKGELCTPTGAAILKTFAHSFGSMPAMSIEKIGYGMGKKNFAQLNCVRAFAGTGITVAEPVEAVEAEAPEVYEISCNLDDITAEELAFSCDKLFESGALDVFVVPAVMKKGRSGHILTALTYEKDREIVSKTMLKHTTTRGIRMSICERLTLDCRHEKVETEFGSIDVKVSSGHGITKTKPEYESVAAAAKKHGVTFSQVQKSVLL